MTTRPGYRVGTSADVRTDADIEALLRATEVLHDALCSPAPSREYQWSEISTHVKTVSAFSRAYPDAAAVEEALYRELPPERHQAFIAMSGEVQAALADLLVHQREDSH